MKKVFAVWVVTAMMMSCDDGDIIITNFDFDETIELCDTADESQYVFYNTNTANEGIALQFRTTEDILSERIDQPNFAAIDTLYALELDGVQDKVVYRKFKSQVTNDYFCNIIPPAEPIIDEELISSSADLFIRVTGFMDDNDGIPAEIEDPENFDSGDLTLMNDTDGDKIPDIYDDDDDGDNVPTINEGVVLNDDGTINFELSKNSNGNEKLDYLDPDDDGDGVLTRYEDANGDLNPMNDNSDGSTITGDDYLNDEIAVTTMIDSFRIHNFKITDRKVYILMKNLNYESTTITINKEEQKLGTYSISENLEKTFTPEFN